MASPLNAGWHISQIYARPVLARAAQPAALPLFANGLSLRSLVVISVLLNILGAAVLVKEVISRQGGLQSLTAQSRPLQLKQDIQASLPIRRDHVVLLGDSILALAETGELFPRHFVNRAISGDTTSDVLARLPPNKTDHAAGPAGQRGEISNAHRATASDRNDAGWR
jgi:hypothetical protein